MADESDRVRLTPSERGMVQSGRMNGSPVGVVAVVEHIVAEKLAEQHRAMCEYSLIEERSGMGCTYTGLIYSPADPKAGA